MTEKPLRYLSLAAKAGRLILGAEECEQALRRGKSGLLILAADAGANTERRASVMAGAAGVRFIKTTFGKSDMAAAVGRGSPVALALVSDEGLAAAFAAAAANALEQEDQK